VWHWAEGGKTPQPIGFTRLGAGALQNAVLRQGYFGPGLELIVGFARMIAVYFGSDDDIANCHVFDSASHADEQHHLGVEVRNRPLGSLRGVGIAHAHFDNADFPEAFIGVEQATFVHVAFRVFVFRNVN
jgi:hypothetical protein